MPELWVGCIGFRRVPSAGPIGIVAASAMRVMSSHLALSAAASGRRCHEREPVQPLHQDSVRGEQVGAYRHAAT
jgi:hypothetical protein